MDTIVAVIIAASPFDLIPSSERRVFHVLITSFNYKGLNDHTTYYWLEMLVLPKMPNLRCEAVFYIKKSYPMGKF
jgi:hypothetical protein